MEEALVFAQLLQNMNREEQKKLTLLLYGRKEAEAKKVLVEYLKKYKEKVVYSN